ncbi:MAG TPA: hypothetical protein VLG14_07390, partial [Sphingomonas sp.]|nr:hypothetical protein [Sphingomonas sp.]
MLASLVVALTAADIPMSGDLPPAVSLQPSSICAADKPRDLVRVRVFPIGMERRIFPSPNEIIEKGDGSSMTRAFWQAAMSA